MWKGTHMRRSWHSCLTTLKARRERGDAIEAYKTMNGFNNVAKNDWFLLPPLDHDRPSTRSNTNVSTEGQQNRKQDVMLRERARTEVRNHSFRLRTARAWNEFPDYVKQAKSVNAFKNSYDAWLLKKSQTQSWSRWELKEKLSCNGWFAFTTISNTDCPGVFTISPSWKHYSFFWSIIYLPTYLPT